MTQKVKLDFVITANAAGVKQAVAQLRSALNSLSASAKGPQQINMALREQMKLHAANINSIKGHTAAIIQLASASELYQKRVSKGLISNREAGNMMRSLWSNTDKYSQSISLAAKEQLKWKNAGFQGFLRDVNGRMTGVAHTASGMGQAMGQMGVQTTLLQQKQALAARGVQSWGRSLVKAGKEMQWTGRQISMGFTLPLVLAGAGLSKLAADVDREITRVVKVYDFGATKTSESVARLRADAQGLARTMAETYGFVATDSLKVMAEFAQQGRRGQELIQLTQETLRTSFLGGVDTDNASRLIRMLEQSADIANGINIRPVDGEVIEGVVNATRGFQDLNDVLNRFNVLENQTVITVADLAEELPDLVGTLNSLNLSVEFGAAALTGMKEAGLNVNEAQTALRTGFQRLVSPTEKAARVFKEATGQDLNALAEGAGSAEQVIVKLADSLRSLDSFDAKSDVLSAIFGNRQSGRISLLFDQIGEMDSAFSRAIGITGGFMGEEGIDRVEAYRISLEETAEVQESMAGKIDIAKASLGVFTAELGNKFLPMITSLVEVATTVVKAFSFIPEPVIKFGLVLGLLAGGFGLLVQIVGTFKNLLGSFVGVVSGRVIKSLEKLGVDTQIYGNVQEAIQAKILHSTAAMQQQNEAMIQLQSTMARAQGYMVPGAAQKQKLDPKDKARMEQGLNARMDSARLQEKKNALRLQVEQRKAAQQELKLMEAVVLEYQKEYDIAYKTYQKHADDLKTLKQKVGYQQAHVKAITMELKAKIELKRLERDEINRSLAKLRRNGMEEVNAAEINKLLLKRKVINAQILKYGNTLTIQTEKQAAMEAQQLALQEKRKVAAAAVSRYNKDSLYWQVERAKAEFKSLGLHAELGKLLNSERLSTAQIKELTDKIGKEKLENLQLQLKELNAAEKLVATKQQELKAENQIQAATRKTMLQRIRGSGGRGVGIGGAAMGIGFAAQSAIPDSNVAGGLISALVSGGITGGMIGGPIGIAVGIASGLLQAIGPLKTLAENLGLLARESKTATENAKEFAEALELPFNIDPFEGTLAGGDSLSAEMQFAASDYGKEFLARFGPEGNEKSGAHKFISDTVMQLQISGMSPEEIEKHVQPAINAAELDIRLSDLVFEGTDEFAARVESLMDEGIEHSDFSGKIYNAFEIGMNSISAGKQELAQAAFEEIFTDEFMLMGANEHLALADAAGPIRELFQQLNEAQQASFLGDSGFENLTDLITAIQQGGMAPTYLIQSYVDALGGIDNVDPTKFGEINEAFFNFKQASTEAGFVQEDFVEKLRELAEMFGQELPEGVETTGAFIDSFMRGSSLGGDTAEVYAKKLRQLILVNDALPPAVRKVNDVLIGEAAAFAAAAMESGNFADELEDLAEMEAINSAFASNYRSGVESAFADLGDTLIEPFRASLEARMEYFDDALEALGEHHGEVKETLSDRHSEESRLADEAQSDQLDALKDAQSAELEAYQQHTDELKRQAEDTADAKIAAIEAEEESVDKLEERRQRAFERERARQEYLVGLRNSSVSLAIALASGDVEQATQLQGEMQLSTSDYHNSLATDAIEERNEEAREAREAEKELIKEQLEVELDRIETSRDSEQEALRDTHETRLELIEEQHRLADKALQDRQDAESKALDKSLAREREALQERKKIEQEAGQARIDAASAALAYAIDTVNPETEKDWHRVVDVMNARMTSRGETNPSLVEAVETASIESGKELQGRLVDAAKLAIAKIEGDEKWGDAGEVIANAIAAGAFQGLPIDNVSDLFDWITAPPTSPGTAYHAPGAGPLEGTFHSGGHIGGGLPSRSGLRADERPIIAQTGEYMLQRSAVNALGMPFLEQLNNARTPNDGLRFHTGGLVGAIGAAAMLPVVGLIRAMGEAGGRRLTDEGMAGFAQRFPNAGRTGGGPLGGAESIEAFMAAIKQKESGGDYSAKNPSGATGAYQILRSNWPNWARQAGLPANARWTAENQDLVARTEMLRLYNEFNGNWGAVAASWYGGPGAGRRYVADPTQHYITRKQHSHGRTYPSIAEYVAAILTQAQLSGVASGIEGFGPFAARSSGEEYTPGQSTGYGPGPSGSGVGNIVDVGKALLMLPQPYGGGGVRVGEHPRFGGVSPTAHNPSGHHYSNRSGTGGDALDINAGPGGENDIEKRWMDTIFIPWVNKNVVNAAQVLWRVRGHYNHAHIGGGNTQLRQGWNLDVPGLRNGGKVTYDNTIANLHAGETVLTKPLTDKLERGINNMTSTSNMNIYATPGMNEERLANLVIQRLEAREKLRGARAGV